jgi:fido (protein-threonine AMPylation protein)
MIVYDLVGREDNQTYRDLAAANLDRQYSFLKTVVGTALSLQRTLLSHEVIFALNYHAIACLHAYCGEYRPCPVIVGERSPPQHYQVPALMRSFVDEVNRNWDTTDAISLATHVLWRINYIHPFVNGNGRTARATCYYVLCLKAGGLVRGAPILPELIRANRPAYVAALQHAHKTYGEGSLDVSLLHALISQLIGIQVSSASPPPTPAPAPTAAPDAASSLSTGG